MTESNPRFMESIIPEDELAKEQTKKVNLDPSKSRFTRKIRNKEEFEQLAVNANNQLQKNVVDAFELGKQFKALLNDKTIVANKNFLHESKEKEIIGKLIQYAIDVNCDQNETEGMGSVALITLLSKCLLTLRDRYNDIEYKYALLERNAIKLEEKFNRLSSLAKADDK